MIVPFKEALLKASLLGGICHCLISPSYGMEREEITNSKEIGNYKLHQKKDDISSLSSIEQKIVKKNQKGVWPSREDIERLQKDPNFLTAQEIDPLVNSAEAGDLTCLYSLGWLVDKGGTSNQLISKKDTSTTLILEKAKIFYLWTKAQKQDNPEAWVELGTVYKNGSVVKKDYAEAMKWYLKASEKNNALAQSNVGWLYHNGQGVEGDYTEAMKWYLKAAEQNYALAQCKIGELFHNGQGVERDYTEAMKWYLKAAEQNSVEAQKCIDTVHSYLGFEYLDSDNANSFFRFSFDFKVLTTDQQHILLKLLQKKLSEKKHPKELTIKNCSLLTKDTLIQDIGVDFLTHLSIERNNFLDNEFIKVLEEKSKNLNSLSLNNLQKINSFKGSFPLLTELTLKSCENLKAIDIKGSNLRTLTASFCSTLDEVKVSEHSLHILDLSHNKSIKDDVLELLLKVQTQLKKLNVIGSSVLFPEVRSANHLYPIELLKVLSVEESKNLLDFIVRLLNKDTSLKTLGLFNKMGVEGVKAIAEALKGNTILETLNLGGNKIGNVESIYISKFLKGNISLKTLDLYNNNIEAKGIKAIAEALKGNMTLKNLNLGYNKIEVAGGLSISKFLKENISLKALNLNGNNLQEEGAKAIAEALEGNTVLEDLDMGCNNIGDKTVKLLANGLPYLKTLELTINYIKSPGAQLLANGNLSSLTSLQLYATQMGAQGIQFLANGNFPSLTDLGLWKNKIGDDGVQALTLGKLVSLTTVNLRDNDVSPKGAESIGEWFKRNTTLKTLNLTENKIGNEGIKFLEKGLESNTTLQNLKLSKNKIGETEQEALQKKYPKINLNF